MKAYLIIFDLWVLFQSSILSRVRTVEEWMRMMNRLVYVGISHFWENGRIDGTAMPLCEGDLISKDRAAVPQQMVNKNKMNHDSKPSSL